MPRWGAAFVFVLVQLAYKRLEIKPCRQMMKQTVRFFSPFCNAPLTSLICFPFFLSWRRTKQVQIWKSWVLFPKQIRNVSVKKNTSFCFNNEVFQLITVRRRNVPSSQILECFGGGQNSWFPQDRNSLRITPPLPGLSSPAPKIRRTDHRARNKRYKKLQLCIRAPFLRRTVAHILKTPPAI